VRAVSTFDVPGLRLERQGRIAVLTLDRPDRLNALDGHLRDGIPAAVREVRDDDEVRALVITGTGKGFCSGVDLGGRPTAGAERPEQTQGDRLDELGWVGRQAMVVYGLDKPTIAAVNGVAAGAGMSLSLACDLRVGGPSARFRTVFLERNLSPDSGMSWFLPRIVGYSRAIDLILTSRDVDAAEAYRMGLLDRLHDDDEGLLDHALELAEQMAALPPLAARSAKRVVQHNLGIDLEEGLRYEMAGLSYARRASNDAREAMASFREKRRPDFTGT
jgi:2-(1,2-epoxy-1,2-dihydrophenyl)acetyl-CoA isomerase